MNDSLEARPNQREVNTKAIQDGILDAQTISQTVLDEISKELDKPLDDMDLRYVNVCEKLLALINHERGAMIDIDNRINHKAILCKKWQHRPLLSTALQYMRFTLAVCLVIFLIFGGIFNPTGR